MKFLLVNKPENTAFKARVKEQNLIFTNKYLFKGKLFTCRNQFTGNRKSAEATSTSYCFSNMGQDIQEWTR